MITHAHISAHAYIYAYQILYGLFILNVRPPDKSVYWKTILFISHPKHMLWVLKRTVLTVGKKIIAI